MDDLANLFEQRKFSSNESKHSVGAFKMLGGARHQLSVCENIIDIETLSFEHLKQSAKMTFATTTDGNHGRGGIGNTTLRPGR